MTKAYSNNVCIFVYRGEQEKNKKFQLLLATWDFIVDSILSQAYSAIFDDSFYHVILERLLGFSQTIVFEAEVFSPDAYGSLSISPGWHVLHR